jgi:RND family efflux transporter MFP subunit|tara:strand:- start:569 stop:1744 length:1176 start_codon:yes stop_codon:yes gene_type:complete
MQKKLPAFLSLTLVLIMATLADVARAADGPAVKTVSPQKITIRRTSSQPATARAWHEAELFAKVAGYASKVTADIGDAVKAGQTLMLIDVPEIIKTYERQQAELSLLEYKREQFQASVGVARAELGALQSEYNRVQALIKTKAVTQRVGDETKSRYESAKARLVVAEAEVKSAASSVMVGRKTLEETEVMMQYASLKAPFAGVVTQRSVDPGDLVRNEVSSERSREPLFTVSKIDVLRVTVPVPERDAVWVKKGDTAKMEFPAIPGEPLKNVVARRSGRLDPKTRTMAVEVDIPNANGRLIPGMYCKVEIIMQEKLALVVPSEAVRFDLTGGESIVYVVKDDNSISHVPVKIGIDDGHNIEILSGLSGGEQVVMGMLGRLKDGQEVSVLSN